MKSILVSEFAEEWNTGFCIKRAMENQGYEVEPFDQYTIDKRLKFSLPLRIAKLNFNLYTKAKKIKPDMLLVFKGRFILPKTIQRIRKMGIKTVLWHPDPEYDIVPWVYHRAKVSDFFFHIAAGCVDQYKNRGIKNVHWLSEGCDPTIHKPTMAKDNEIDLLGSDASFSGHYTKKREGLTRHLINSGIDLKVWHHGWENMSGLKGCMNRFLSTTEFCKVCNTSKVILGNDRWPEIERSLSMRAFMIMGCGGFLLTNHTKNIEDVFTPGKHLDVYDNEKDCAEKIKYYLENEKERISIQKEGHKEAYKNHTFEKRIENMTKIVFG